MSYTMRAPCPKCAGTEGRIETKNVQDCVFCLRCGWFCYNAPKTETGRAVRSTTTVHNGIKPQQRTRILVRANRHCELCGKPGNLHVGHLLSVKDGMDRNLSDEEINDDENLAAFCDECNLGMGATSIPLWLAVGLVITRIKNRKSRGESA